MRAVAVFLIVTLHVLGIPSSASACMENCYAIYNEPLWSLPGSNWIDDNGYESGDIVWIKSTVSGGQVVDIRWYVLHWDHPQPYYQPHECCPNGPWYVSGGGTLFHP